MVSVPDFEEAVEPPALPPSPPDVLSSMEAEPIALPTYSIISRPSVGTTGKRIHLLANFFKAAADATDATFSQYNVCQVILSLQFPLFGFGFGLLKVFQVAVTSEDKRTVESKGIRRKLINRLHQTYSSELGGKSFAYDGERTLYTVGPLPDNKFEFNVFLEETFARW